MVTFYVYLSVSYKNKSCRESEWHLSMIERGTSLEKRKLRCKNYLNVTCTLTKLIRHVNTACTCFCAVLVNNASHSRRKTGETTQ